MDILRSIGNTSIVQLCRVVPPGCADVFVKLEWENPTGSLKDRMAYAVISRAEGDGRLNPGDTVVEYTGGSTGDIAVDAFVHCVGTGASSRGVATVLKRYKPEIEIVVVEPAESSVLLGGEPGPHKVEGVGIGYIPPLWEPTLVDRIVPITTSDAEAMTRRLAREEALFAGTSSGANVLAAIDVARRLGRGAKVVTLMADSGLKYLSTSVYRGQQSRAI